MRMTTRKRLMTIVLGGPIVIMGGGRVGTVDAARGERSVPRYIEQQFEHEFELCPVSREVSAGSEVNADGNGQADTIAAKLRNVRIRKSARGFKGKIKTELAQYSRSPFLPRRFRLYFKPGPIIGLQINDGQRPYSIEVEDDGKLHKKTGFEDVQVEARFSLVSDEDHGVILEQEVRRPGRDGVWMQSSHLEDDGKVLVVAVTIDSRRFAEPMMYSIRYCRR